MTSSGKPNRTSQLKRFFITAFAGAWLAWLLIVLGKDGLFVLPVRVRVLAAIMAHAAWNAAVGVQNRLTVVADRRLPPISTAMLLAVIALTVSRGLQIRTHAS